MPPSPIPINVSETQNGVIGSASALTFELSLFSDYDFVTISGCDPTSNQFNTSFTVQDEFGATVPIQTSRCPDNSQQSEVVISNAAAGVYSVTFSGLDGAANPSTDTWTISITTTSLTTTTATRRGSDSDSGSESDSSDDMMSLFFGAQEADENASQLLGDKAREYETYRFVLNLNKTSWMNVWGIFVVIFLMNAMCIGCYFKKRNDELLRV